MTLSRELEESPTRKAWDAESYIKAHYLNGPMAEFVRRVFREVPSITPTQLDQCIEGYMKTLYMDQGGKILY